jgi:hypothetical protein
MKLEASPLLWYFYLFTVYLTMLLQSQDSVAYDVRIAGE